MNCQENYFGFLLCLSGSSYLQSVLFLFELTINWMLLWMVLSLFGFFLNLICFWRKSLKFCFGNDLKLKA